MTPAAEARAAAKAAALVARCSTSKRASNNLRDRVQAALQASGQMGAARLAWTRAFASRRDKLPKAAEERARLVMLATLDAGQTVAAAEEAARVELSREPAA